MARKNYHLRQFRNKLNQLAINNEGIPFTQNQLDVFRNEFISNLSKDIRKSKLDELIIDLSNITPSLANLKICSICNIEQPLTEFWVSKASRRIVELCKSCASLKAAKDKNYGVNFFSNSLGSARKRATTKSLPFDIDAEYLHSIFQKDRKCPIFGTPMQAGVRGNMNDSPSLDKIVPNKGYVKDNVWYISMRANKIKSDHSLNDILLTAYGILAKQRELGIDNDVDVQLEKQLKLFANRLKRKE